MIFKSRNIQICIKAVLSITALSFFYSYQTRNKVVINITHEQRRLETTVIRKPSSTSSKETEKPTMHTYIDYNEPYVDRQLVKLWFTSWTEAGFDVVFLSHEDAKKHPKYEIYNKLLDDKSICCLPRQSFYRHLAMSTVMTGGFYSEIFTFPLHKNTLYTNVIPNNGKLTIYDGKLGSILSGKQSEYERMATLILNPNNVQKNAMITIRYIIYQDESIFNIESSSLLINFFDSINTSFCNTAKDKFIVRFHDGEIMNQAKTANVVINDISKDRFDIIKKWVDSYKSTCWNSDNTIPSSILDITNSISNPLNQITLNDADRTTITENEHYKKIMDGTKLSELFCDDVSCKVTNACIDPKNGVLKLITNSDDYYKKLRDTLSRKLLSAWVCTDCSRLIKVEKFQDLSQIWSNSATLGVGLDILNCGHHLGDVLWPLIRLHLKYRSVEEVIENGIGFLFLQAPVTPCDTLYHAVSEQVIRYHVSNTAVDNNEGSMCFENIYLGTLKMNFMPSSGKNIAFLPYDNFNRDMYTMKSLFYRIYNLNLDPKEEEVDTILITQKRKGYGKLRTLKYHNIANIPQIIKMIQTNYPKYKAHIISWEDYNMKQQAYIMSKTKLMISLPGSAIMNGFLLQNSSSLLCYCQVGEIQAEKDDASTIYNEKGIKFQKSNEFLLWFDHFNYGNFVQICDEPYTYIHGLDTIVNVEELNRKMHELGM